MNELVAYVTGIGVKGPGLSDWPQAEAALSGRRPYARSDTTLLAPAVLPPTERRRAGRVVKLALAVGLEATRRANADPKHLPVVFASSGGDGDNCHEICQTLASPNRALSPTRFHNSVHNAPAGYWSIAAGAQVPSTTICAYDASFAAGLLETFAQVVADGRETALIAYDLDYPSPLRESRPGLAAFGLALVLQPGPGPQVLARLTARLDTGAPDRLTHPELEALRGAIPAAQGLGLLEALALGKPAAVNIRYLEPMTLRVEVSPCG
jgi:hypothetical protein